MVNIWLMMANMGLMIIMGDFKGFQLVMEVPLKIAGWLISWKIPYRR